MRHARGRELHPWWPKVNRDLYPGRQYETSDDEEPWGEKEKEWGWDGEYEAAGEGSPEVADQGKDGDDVAQFRRLFQTAVVGEETSASP